MKGKRVIAGILLVGILATALAGCKNADVTKKEREKPVITLGSDSYPPYNYLNEDGIPTGIDVELATEAFRRMGYQVDVVQINWEKKKELVESGEIDCIMGCFSMEGRLDDYRWAGPYIASRQVVAVNESSDIYKLSDLEGKNLAVQSTTKPEGTLTGTFETVCVSDSYTDFIGAMVYGAANGSIEEYSGENDWSAADQSGHGLGLMTADQNRIQIAEEQHLNDDGYYTFTIAQESLPNVASVQYNLYMKFDDETPLVYLGSDNWLDYDDQTGVVTDTFQGYWPALPDGSLLSMYVVEESEDYTIFSSPIVLNGQETNLRFAYLYGETEGDGEWMVLGAWDGIDDESGQADKEMTEIKKEM